MFFRSEPKWAVVEPLRDIGQLLLVLHGKIPPAYALSSVVKYTTVSPGPLLCVAQKVGQVSFHLNIVWFTVLRAWD